jgi:hypothetical protein
MSGEEDHLVTFNWLQDDPSVVSLRNTRSGKVVEFVVDATSEFPSILLSPGDYVATIRSLSPGDAATPSFRLEVSADDEVITLPSTDSSTQEMREKRSREGRRDTSVRWSDLQSLIQAAEGPVESEHVQTREQGGTRSNQKNFENDPTGSLTGLPDQLPFTIGLSHDQRPGSPGGWGPLDSGLKIQVHPLSDFSFEVRFSEWPHLVQRSSRLRLTLSVSGRPALRLPLPMFSSGLTLRCRQIEFGGQLDLAAELIPNDQYIAAIIAAMDNFDREEAEAVLNWAVSTPRGVGIRRVGLPNVLRDAPIDFLFYQEGAIWDALAIAALLVQTRQLSAKAAWIQSLQGIAEHVPDFHVLFAWVCAVKGEENMPYLEKTILDRLIQARRCGAMTFAHVNSLALDMLKSLSLTANAPEVAARAKKELQYYRNRSRRRLPVGPYFVWEQAGEHLQRGELPLSHYTQVAKGALSMKHLALTEFR